MDLYHPLWAEINLDNLKYNIQQIKRSCEGSEIIGIVKANGYGHGAVEITNQLIKYGVKTVAVANLMEAIELRKNNIDIDVMVLGALENKAINKIIEYNISPSIVTYDFAEKLNEKALSIGKTIKAHIGIDTGMGRIGFRISDKSIEEIKNILNMKGLEIVSLFSHFSDADGVDKDYVEKQLKEFNLFKERILEGTNKKLKLNIANSAAITDVPESYYDYVRPGIIQYGYYPSNDVKRDINLKPVLTWKCKILYLKTVEPNEYIGYGRTYKTNKKTVIATIPVGYADGYFRELSGKGYMIVNGKLAPVIGRVCMDQCMIDVTAIKDVKVGQEVIILGEDSKCKFNADDMAKILGTINYECLCAIGRRTARVYIENNKITNIKEFI